MARPPTNVIKLNTSRQPPNSEGLTGQHVHCVLCYFCHFGKEAKTEKSAKGRSQHLAGGVATGLREASVSILPFILNPSLEAAAVGRAGEPRPLSPLASPTE